jgi:hypothetical protein
MGSYSEYKNLNNLRDSKFIIEGNQLLEIIQSAIIKGVSLSPEERGVVADVLALKIIKKYDLQEITERAKGEVDGR